jgi:hypothetical protein
MRKTASPFDAFNILKDGNWHSVDELKAKCGINGDKRARELRGVAYGSFDVECATYSEMATILNSLGLPKSSSYYRIRPDELLRKKKEAAFLSERLKPVTVDELAKTRVLKLTVHDLIYVYNMLTNPQLFNTATSAQSLQARHANIVSKIASLIPSSDMLSPFYLMEQDVW